MIYQLKRMKYLQIKNETELTNNAKITLERIKKGVKFQV